MIGIIALVIATAACISLSIREAAETAKEDTINSLTVTATLSYDRTSVMEDMKNTMPDSGEDGGFNRGDFDFSALTGSSLTLEDYLNYADCLSDEDGYYYTLTLSLDASGDLVPYGEDETEEDSDGTEDTEADSSTDSGSAGGNRNEMGGMPGMGGGFVMGNMASGDFTITGYSSYTAMLSMFGEDGTYTISSGSMFEESATDYACIISDELALYNNLSAGDSISLANPNYADETYTFLISGIYTNSASSTGNSMFSRSDPANNIYMNSYALQALIDSSAAAGNTETDDDGETVSVVLEGETDFTYLLASVENYETFQAEAAALGLPENYVISSSDLSSYESSLTPLNTLSTMTGWFFLIVLAIGGIILIVLNMFNLRERKYEVGVLAAIGMKKYKVMTQFVCELFLITFVAIIIGSGIGATVSVPVTNALLQQQIEKTESSSDQLNNNFGFGEGQEMDFGNLGGKGGMTNPFENLPGSGAGVSYVESVSSATDLTVILQMVLVGALLTIISSMAAMITIMRYEPLQILSNRS